HNFIFRSLLGERGFVCPFSERYLNYFVSTFFLPISHNAVQGTGRHKPLLLLFGIQYTQKYLFWQDFLEIVSLFPSRIPSGRNILGVKKPAVNFPLQVRN